MFRSAAAVLAVHLLVAATSWTQEPAKPKDRATSEKEFAESLSGATLTGSWVVEGKKGEPKVEKYTITNVSKVNDETWLFTSRIQYGQYDVSLPLPLRVEWAGDTPVITLTDQAIPGLGTFTARVLFYRGRYVGTWQHGKAGGQMWGSYSKTAEADKSDAPAKKE